MQPIVRVALLYLALLALFRVSGKRALGELSPFNFVLLLIISEAVSNAMLAGDHSVTGALVAVTALLAMNLALELLKLRSPRVKALLEDGPVVLVRDGVPVAEAMRKERVEESDVLEAARLQHGIERLAEVRLAVLEPSGKISISRNR
ncbi:MAG TPA: YetF domain-containing protein [Gemmatimonadales bacterium]|nr:YetF domain-containing protein [Gemmatimonadales bacterium]